jgi:5-aminopentanamidase
MKLALHQGPSPAGDVEAAFAAIDRTLAAAAAAGATMAVFPELFLPGYNCADIPARAQPLDGPWGARLAGLARRHGCGITLGLAERDGDRLYNSAVALGPTAHGSRITARSSSSARANGRSSPPAPPPAPSTSTGAAPAS